MKSTKNKAILEAARAHSCLVTFASVVALLEMSNVTPASHSAASRITRICEHEHQKQLRLYDKFAAEASNAK